MSTPPVPDAPLTSGEPTPMAKTGRRAPSNSSAPAAEKTATRPPRKGPKHLGVVRHSELVKREVATLRAEGMANMKIAKALDMSVNTVTAITKLPDVQEQIDSLRNKYRLVAQERGFVTATKMWDALDKAVEADEAKKANLYAFGLGAVDRISHNTSGERQKVEVSGIPGEQAPKIEIRNLLLQLFPNNDKPALGN